MLSVEVGSTTSENLNCIILGLGTYFSAVNVMLKQKRAMRFGMRKPCISKVRRCAARMIDINKYLAVLPGEKESDFFCDTESIDMFFNSTPNSWSRQAYVQGFYCESNIKKNL